MEPDFDKICFVLMPFGEEGTPEREQLDDIYENIIRRAVEESGLGLKCVRADEITRSGSIIDDIILYAAKSRIVIADLSGRNANVFYELGIRHSFSGKTILLAQSKNDLPFDIMPMRTIIYSKETLKKAENARCKLVRFLESTERNSPPSVSPVLSIIKDVKVSKETTLEEARFLKRLNFFLGHREKRHYDLDGLPTCFKYYVWGGGFGIDFFGLPERLLAVYTVLNAELAISEFHFDVLDLVYTHVYRSGVKTLNLLYAIDMAVSDHHEFTAEIYGSLSRGLSSKKIMSRAHTEGLDIVRGEGDSQTKTNLSVVVSIFDRMKMLQFEKEIGIH